MSYANLLDINCADKEEYFQRLRDFLCKRNGTYDYSTTGIGWTLHDSVYATDEDNCAINDYFVVYSPGENGDEDIYIKVSWTSGQIKFNGFQSWDASTHAGSTNGFATTISNHPVAETGDTYKLSLYGDLDAIIIIKDITVTNAYTAYAGKMNPGWGDISQTAATCATTLAAGSDVSIVVDAVPSNWAVGKEVYIRTTHNNAMSTVKMEKIEIKTLSGTTITADLANSYTADSKLSDFVGYAASGTTQISGQLNNIISESGAINQTAAHISLALTATSFDPSNYEDKFYLLEMFFQAAVGPLVYFKHIRIVPTIGTAYAIGDSLVEDDGTIWRAFIAFSARHVAVKEV